MTKKYLLKNDETIVILIVLMNQKLFCLQPRVSEIDSGFCQVSWEFVNQANVLELHVLLIQL